MLKNPNRILWDNYEKDAINRGKLVVNILSARINLPSARILDIGCGTGGIAFALARAGAHVRAIDPDPDKIQQAKQFAHKIDNIAFRQGDISNEPGTGYDVMILNDVLEHVDNPQSMLQSCREKLKNNGLIYITTPNKFSVINILCDPHYSLPFVALLSRNSVKKIVAGLLKWHNKQKQDFAQLLSFKHMKIYLEQNHFDWKMVNTTTAKLAFNKPEMLWSRPSHLIVIKTIKRFKLEKNFCKLINNRHGLFNKIINPTWFILAKKV